MLLFLSESKGIDRDAIEDCLADDIRTVGGDKEEKEICWMCSARSLLRSLFFG